MQEGQLITTLGNTGRSSGPHLHYELRYWGQLVNPAIHTMAILHTKWQLDPTLLTGCDKDAADRRPKIAFSFNGIVNQVLKKESINWV